MAYVAFQICGLEALQELTAGIIRELITKIYVGDVRKVDGEKVQSIEIHYRFIGSLSDGAGKYQFLTENPNLQNNLAVNITLVGVYRIKDSRNSNRGRRRRMGCHQSA